MISEFMECESQVIELCWTFLYKKVIRQYPSYNCLFQQLNGNCIHCTELHQSACLECAGWMFPQTRIINVCCVWWLILCHNTNHWIGNTHGHIIVGLQGHEAWCRDHLLMMIQEKVCSLLVNEVSFQFYNRKYVDMCRETTSASLNLNQCPEFYIIAIHTSYMKLLWSIFDLSGIWSRYEVNFHNYFKKWSREYRNVCKLPKHYKTPVIEF